MMGSIMPQLLQTLYSTVHHILWQTPDLKAAVQNRKRLPHYNLNGVTVKLAETEDFHQLTNTLDKFRTSTRITDRLARGDICVVAYKHGNLAHACWAALTPLPAWDGHSVHLASDEAYTYDSYTLPTFRRQGIAGEAKAFQLTYLAQQGFRCAYTDTRIDNLNTQRGRKKWIREGRARILGMISIAKRFGQTRCMFSAETEDTRPLVARLYDIPPHHVQLRSIDQFLGKQQPT
jgi:hypothetical protein